MVPPALAPAGKDGAALTPQEEAESPDPQHSPEPGSGSSSAHLRVYPQHLFQVKEEAARPRGRQGGKGSTLNLCVSLILP